MGRKICKGEVWEWIADELFAVAVDAVLSLDQDDLNEKLIGIKKITGGALQDSLFVNGVAFKKTFSYAGFEQQPKAFDNPKIVCLNVELELKAEKDNAEIRVEQVSEYQAVVDAEWRIIIRQNGGTAQDWRKSDTFETADR